MCDSLLTLEFTIFLGSFDLIWWSWRELIGRIYIVVVVVVLYTKYSLHTRLKPTSFKFFWGYLQYPFQWKLYLLKHVVLGTYWNGLLSKQAYQCMLRFQPITTQLIPKTRPSLPRWRWVNDWRQQVFWLVRVTGLPSVCSTYGTVSHRNSSSQEPPWSQHKVEL